jgi:hypothetical protein
MLKSKFLPTLAGAAALGLALAATPASADTITSTLNESNAGVNQNFGTVTITTITPTGACTPDCALVTFTAASGFSFLDSQIADLNTTSAVTTFEPVNPTTLTGTFGSQNVDGFGTFSLTTDCTGANGCDPSVHRSTVSYDIDGTFTSATQILAFNSSGFDAAAHMIGPSTFNGGNTFFAAEAVPAPPIGHGLVVLLAIGGVLFGGKLLQRA